MTGGIDAISAAFQPPTLPATYESDEARDRITTGLTAAGFSPTAAAAGAVDGLKEAPFAPPDEEGWAFTCARARACARHHAAEEERQ